MFISWRRWLTRSSKSRPTVRWRAGGGSRLRVRELETRQLPSTFVVTSNADSGPFTLRTALAQAVSGETIRFNLPAGSTMIMVLSELPAVTADHVTIDGYTGQTGASQNNMPLTGGDNASVPVTLEWAGTGGAAGLILSGGYDTVDGLTITNFSGDGIDVNTHGNDNIWGNFIVSNAGNGVSLTTANNMVGGTNNPARNVISGNGGTTLNGIDIASTSATGNSVDGNYIGLTTSGGGGLGNGVDGVKLEQGATGNSIGSPVVNGGNIISCNGGNGVEINDTVATNDVVQGNYIGTDKTGKVGTYGNPAKSYGNVANGVLLIPPDTSNPQTAVGPSGNTIGGTTSGTLNVISNNGNDGVQIACGSNKNLVEGDYLGTTSDGKAALGNAAYGVRVTGASSNTLGGLVSGPASAGQAPGNLISGNTTAGVGLKYFFSGDSSRAPSLIVVEGNLIGTDYTGTAKIPNGDGVEVYGNQNTVGGTATGAINIISGNTSNGVYLLKPSSENQVVGNWIGTDNTGLKGLGNSYIGVLDSGTSNTIGGTAAGSRNVICANGTHGVDLAGTSAVLAGNYIGVGKDGTTALGNGENGVVVDSTGSQNTIGGTSQAAGNTIDNNGTSLGTWYGIYLLGNNNYVDWNSVFSNKSGWLRDGGTGNTIGGHNSHG
jgi:titin